MGSFNLADIFSPAPNGVVRGGTVRVEVRVAPGVRSFRAWIGSRPVTGSFGRRARNGVRVATFHAGRIVRFGPNKLRVRTAVRRGREDFDVVRFVVARSSTSVVTGFVGRPFAAQRGHVKLTVRLRNRGVAVHVRVNTGRAFALGGNGTVRTVFLDAGAGLRYGSSSTGNTRPGGRIDVCNDGKGGNARGSISFRQFGKIRPIRAPRNPLHLSGWPGQLEI